MENVPSFAELGKNARDVFMTGYHYGKGLIKLNIKTISASKRFEMMSNTILNFESSKLNGVLETKYKANAAELLLKWTTEGMLFLGYEINGLLMKDVQLLSEFTYNPETAAKSIKVGSKFANEKINASSEISNDSTSTSILGSIVVKCKDVLLGYRGGYNTSLNTITKNDISMVFGYSDIDFHLRCVCIPHEYGLSMLYKVNPDVDVAMNGIYARYRDMQKWTLGAGTKYKIDEHSTLRLKFNTDLQLATSLSQKLNDGVTLIVSFNIDCVNIIRGSHRVGLALNIEA